MTTRTLLLLLLLWCSWIVSGWPVRAAAATDDISCEYTKSGRDVQSLRPCHAADTGPLGQTQIMQRNEDVRLRCPILARGASTSWYLRSQYAANLTDQDLRGLRGNRTRRRPGIMTRWLKDGAKRYPFNTTSRHGFQDSQHYKISRLGHKKSLERGYRSALRMRDVTVFDEGVYFCVVENQYGTMTAKFHLVVDERVCHNPVLGPTYLIRGPENQTVTEGHFVSFDCHFIFFGGSNTLIWRFQPSAPNTSSVLLDEFTGRNRIKFRANLSDSGRYTCKHLQAIGHYWFSDEGHAWLTVLPAPVVTPLSIVEADRQLWLKVIFGLIPGAVLFILVTSVICRLARRRRLTSLVFTKLPEMADNALYNTAEFNFGYRIPVSGDLELARDRLEVREMLGQGHFGAVHIGSLDRQSPLLDPIPVAVKKLKDNATEADFQQLIKELVIMSKLGNHANVISLLGYCTRDGPLLLVLELAELGDLRTYLRARDPRVTLTSALYAGVRQPAETLSTKDMLNFSYQVASGMDYLSGKEIVHRDLAARNLLLTSDKVVKLADFGLTRHVDQSSYYIKSDGRCALPVKWMAPESISDRKTSVKSDVWSFGIVLYEIFSFGADPYPHLSTDELPQLGSLLSVGLRNPRPPDTPLEIHELMLKCWDLNPRQRPSFNKLREQLATLLNQSSSVGYLDLRSASSTGSLSQIGQQSAAASQATVTSQPPPVTSQIAVTTHDDGGYVEPGGDREALIRMSSSETSESSRQLSPVSLDSGYVMPSDSDRDSPVDDVTEPALGDVTRSVLPGGLTPVHRSLTQPVLSHLTSSHVTSALPVQRAFSQGSLYTAGRVTSQGEGPTADVTARYKILPARATHVRAHSTVMRHGNPPVAVTSHTYRQAENALYYIAERDPELTGVQGHSDYGTGARKKSVRFTGPNLD